MRAEYKGMVIWVNVIVSILFMPEVTSQHIGKTGERGANHYNRELSTWHNRFHNQMPQSLWPSS